MLSASNSPYYSYSQPQGLFPVNVGPEFPSSQKPDNAYLHATLQQIDHLANEDVEMQAPLSEHAAFLVTDTNILLHHFEVLAQFVDEVERNSLPVIVIVPGAVIYELDGQKNRDGLAWFARRATSWLLQRIKERRSVKGQAQEETCKSTGNWKIREPGEILNHEMFNDSLILDCCMYFSRGRPTFLCSADNNLCITSQSQGIPTVTPSRFWSSRELAYSMYGDKIGLNEFSGYKESYKNPTNDEDDDSMAVDDEGPPVWKSEHPINMLHEAIIDHFSRLLVELVGKVGGEEVRRRSSPQEEANMSRHAPRHRHYTEWGPSECIKYLNEKKGVKVVRKPSAEVFLLKAYTREVPGSKTGREWSRKDWDVALKNLQATGRAWDDISIQESLLFLLPHVDQVFSLPFR
ncbi:hypothetical protein M413DRAFT_426019 [Hebeloma cylindrosporum]|uniref:PIN domain-containing protein n=1 Tax=Hebeloma cylindrosporum TaxID=76867 RepID=A0A0C3CPQ3_HEBCY|nr:hypothetical protein M413DRAFT_426019 [Hebeloma cylindrosporum h7]